MGARWAPEEDARLRDWYAGYVPLAEIGRRLGRPSGAVSVRRRALGIASRRRPWPWPAERDAELIAAAQAGEPAVAVARRLGLPRDAVARHRRRLGYSTGPRRRWTPAEDAAVRGVADDPAALAALAGSLGRSPAAVLERARRHRTAVPARRWSAAEDELLRQGYAACMTCEAIAASLLPGRSARAVAARALRLGLSNYGRRWSAAEDAALRALIARGDTLEEIARTMVRTTAAVRRRAQRLALALALPADEASPRGAPWTGQEDAVLREWRTCEPGRLAQLLGRSDHAVRARMRALGLVPDGSPHYMPPATGALTPAQRRLLVRSSGRVTKRRIVDLARRLEREPDEVLRLVAAERRRERGGRVATGS